MRYFIRLAYNGAPFCGWQIQPNGTSVQGELERAFSLILNEEIGITGCGRTDAGVNARNFYAHFDSLQFFSHEELIHLVHRINRFLPKEIVIFEIFPVHNDLHARFSATERTYKYYISRRKNPFDIQFAYPLYIPLDISLMNEAANDLLTVEDFTSFSKLHTQTHTNICNVTKALWHQTDNQLIFEISANRFLRNMVRAVVGTLLWVGNGKITLEQFKEIVAAKNRCKAGFSVPANALFLEDIRYNFESTKENSK